MLSKFFPLFLAVFASSFLISCGGEGKDYVESTVEDPTQGIKAEIQEVRQDIFKITDEELLPKREDSRIIATFLDGSIDTFTLDQISLKEHTDSRRSAIRAIAFGGMMGYMMGRPMSSGLTRSAYANDKSYNKSSTSGKTALRNTATRKTVRTPKAKSGYGSKKSSKSYGG